MPIKGEIKIRKIYLIIAAVVSVSLVVSSQFFSQVNAATLTNVRAHLSSDLQGHAAIYTIFFTTATAATIEKIHICVTFASHSKARLVEPPTGIGAGTLTAPDNSCVRYSVTTPASIPAGRTIKFVISDILNPVPPINPSSIVSIYTITNFVNDSTFTIVDNGDTVIDVRKIQSAEIADNAVTAVKIAADAVAGSELADVNNFDFGKCIFNPPAISDNSDLFIHLNGGTGANVEGGINLGPLCPTTVAGGNAIAFPQGDPSENNRRIVPKGVRIHCSTSPCHIDVEIRNTSPPSGSFDPTTQTWSFIAWN